jgi:hypothetical protein
MRCPQEYAQGFVDVSEIASLPEPVVHAALRDGIALVGDEQIVESYREPFDVLLAAR